MGQFRTPVAASIHALFANRNPGQWGLTNLHEPGGHDGLDISIQTGTADGVTYNAASDEGEIIYNIYDGSKTFSDYEIHDNALGNITEAMNFGFGSVAVFEYDISNFWSASLYEDSHVYAAYAHLEGEADAFSPSTAFGGLIGGLGNTGNSSGAHLHFHMWTRVDNSTLDGGTAGRIAYGDAVNIDPLKFIREHSLSDWESGSSLYDDPIYDPEAEESSVKIAHSLNEDGSRNSDYQDKKLHFFGEMNAADDADSFIVDLAPGDYAIDVFGLSLIRGGDIAEWMDLTLTTPGYPNNFKETRFSEHGASIEFTLTEKTSVDFSVASTRGDLGQYRVTVKHAPWLQNAPLNPDSGDGYERVGEGGGGGGAFGPGGEVDTPDRNERLSNGDREFFNTNILAGDAQVFRLDLTEAGTLNLSAALMGGTAATLSLVEDANGDGVITTGEIINQIDMASVSNGTLTLSDTLERSGERYVIVSSVGAAGTNSEVRLTASLSSSGSGGNANHTVIDLPDPLPSDPFTQSEPGSLNDDGYPRRGEIDSAGDIDYFETNVLAGGRSYVFNATPYALDDAALSNLRMYVYDAGGTLVGSAATTPGGLAQVEVDVPDGASGRYRIEMLGQSGATGGYSVSYRDDGAVVPPDDHPDSTGTPISVDQTKTAYIGSADDVDHFSLSVSYGYQYTVTVRPTAGSLAPLTHSNINISDTDGDTVLARSVSSGTMSVQFVAFESGTFDLALDALKEATGQAEISVSRSASQLVYPVPTLSGGTFEGDLSTQTTWDPISWTYDSMGMNGDVYNLFVSNGSEVTLYVQENGAEYGGIDLVVYTQDGRVINPEYHGNYPGDGHQFTFSSNSDLGVFYKVHAVYSGSGFNNDFSYRIAAVTTDDKPDGTDTNWELGANQFKDGQIEDYDPGDAFLYTGPRGATMFRVTDEALPSGGTLPRVNSAYLHIYDDEGNEYGNQRIYDLTTDQLRVHLPEEPENLYIEIEDFGSEGYYRLYAQTYADDTPGDESSTRSLAVGGTVAGQLETYGDADAFHVTLKAGANYRIERALLPNGANGEFLALIDAFSGEELARSTRPTLDYVAPVNSSGTPLDALVVIGHERSVNPSKSSDYIGGYEVSLRDITPDDHGDDAGSATSVIVGDALAISIEKANDVDVFNLTGLEVGRKYRIALSADDSSGLPLLSSIVSVIGASGEIVETGASDDNGVLSLEFVAAATSHVFEVSAFGAARFGGVALSIDEVNSAPLLATGNGLVSTNRTVDLMNLIAHTDADGDPIFAVEFRNLSPLLGALLDDTGATASHVSVEPGDSLFFAAEVDAGSAIVVARVFDGEDWSEWRTLPIAVTADNVVVLTGDASENRIYGTSGPDRISAAASDDELLGYAGNDVLLGGGGGDVLNGGNGDDALNGGGGSDTLNGDDGADALIGDRGSDMLNGGVGADILSGGGGGDVLNGGNGDDALNGGGGSDALNGDDGADTLNGGDGADTLIGDRGSDVLNGGAGADILSGGGGRDSFVFALGTGADVITDFRDGKDTLVFQDGLTFVDLNISAVGDDALIQYGSDSVLLNGVNVAALDASDFLFS